MFKKLWSIVFIVTVMPFIAAESGPTRLIIAYEDKTQFPYYIGDDGKIPNEMPGAAVELVKMLEQTLPGIEIELQRYPWKRCLAMLELGRVDAIFNASFTEERASFARYPLLDDGSVDNSRRLTNISYNWYASTRHETSLTQDPLVAAPLGYSIVNQLEAKTYRVVQAPTSLSALRMLNANYIDFAALQSVTGDYLLATHADEFPYIQKLQPAIDDKAYFLLFSKAFYQQHPDFTEQVWGALAQLRETALATIIQRYLTADD